MFYYTKDSKGKIKSFTQSEKMVPFLSGEVFTTDSEIVDYYGGCRIKSELTEEQLEAWDRYQQVESELAQINTDWDAFLKTPLTYTNGKQYIPAWLFDTYPTVLIGFSSGLFQEAQIGDVTEMPENVVTMNQQEFVGLCTFLQAAWQEAYNTKCQRIQALNDEKAELEKIL